MPKITYILALWLLLMHFWCLIRIQRHAKTGKNEEKFDDIESLTFTDETLV